MILGLEKTKEEIIQDVANIIGLHPSKLRNIYVFGSRVYNTYNLNSDIDMVVVACSMKLNMEIHEGVYNVHITTPDAFKEQLDTHDVHCLECVYAPRDAVIMSTIDYLKDFRISTPQLKKMLISQSAWAWTKARKRIEQGNIIGGAKSLFHSLRILKFGLLIMNYRKIKDFSGANYVWNEIKDFQGLEWNEYQDRWINTKKNLMKELRRA